MCSVAPALSRGRRRICFCGVGDLERNGNFTASIFLSRVTEWGTRTMTTFAQPLPYDDFSISDELVGLLHRATEGGVLELVATLRANQRAILAIQCYGKSHLRRI